MKLASLRILSGVSIVALAVSVLSCGEQTSELQGSNPSGECRGASRHDPVVNQLLNGGFEEGAYAPGNLPDGWTRSAWLPSAEFRWESQSAYKGTHAISITADEPNDASWLQGLSLTPNTNYLFSAWVRTENVAHTESVVDPGANLSIWGTWARSSGVFGTSDWTLVRLPFNSGATGEVTVAARLGHWGGATTGTVWFDDVQVTRIDASDPHPRWRVLVLVYGETDFSYLDDQGGTHRVTAAMTEGEKQLVKQVAREFVLADIPALTDGNMIPRLEVRFTQGPLTSLSPYFDRWWPSPDDTVEDLDPAFDSVIVIWDPRGTDEATGQPVDLNSAAGLTPPMGRNQAYTTAIVQAAVTYGHRNVFKHEWGHSILSFFEDAGASPLPTVTNHATPGQYVHWPTGESYVWQDETNGNPIPNSIYSNDSGFTHDYYSGSTATPDLPSRRLGITPSAWAIGGPRSLPVRTLQSPEEWVATLDSQLEEMVALGEMKATDARPIQVRLGAIARRLEFRHGGFAQKQLRAIQAHVDMLAHRGRLEPVNAELLRFGLNAIARP
jgi:hypothetical protein